MAAWCWRARPWPGSPSASRCVGLDYLPWPIVAGLIGGGALAALAYVAHARRTPAPVLDLSLLSIPTFRASVIGGFLFRIGVGALPFLLPLLLQIGFGLTPFQSGLITFSSALGAMTMKAGVATILKRFGFRTVLVANALISSALLAACAAFTPDTPIAHDHGDPAGRRLLPFAAVHQHHHHRLCGHLAAPS